MQCGHTARKRCQNHSVCLAASHYGRHRSRDVVLHQDRTWTSHTSKERNELDYCGLIPSRDSETYLCKPWSKLNAFLFFLILQTLAWSISLSVNQSINQSINQSNKQHGRIMFPPCPEAWNRLRATRTYICNIYLILVLFLLLLYLLRNVFYVKNNYFCTTCSKQRTLERFVCRTWFTRLHLMISIVYSKVLQTFSIILTNQCDISKQVITIWCEQWHDNVDMSYNKDLLT